MRTTNRIRQRRSSDAELARRGQLLEAFDRSGLSGAEFARRHRRLGNGGARYDDTPHW